MPLAAAETFRALALTGLLFGFAQGDWAQTGSYLISTLAGGGMPATAAAGTSLSIPVSYGIAADSSGNIYFSSPGLNAVFKADPTGLVTRIAGTGTAGQSGIGGP